MKKRLGWTTFGAFLCALAYVTIASTARAADSVADFYKGRQIQLIVSTTAGGVYDVFARLMAQYLPQYIPGRPTIVVQNMAGAGGLTATNYIANIAARDGSVIASVDSNIPTSQILAPVGVHFDANQLSWIGSITKDIFVGYVWHNAEVQSFEDAKTKVAIMGGQGVGAATIDFAIVSNALLGTKFKIVTGYDSSGATKLAMQRGELDGTFANGWTSLKVDQKDWLDDHKIKIIIQDGFTRNRDLPDVPLLIDQAMNAEDRQLLELLLARQETNKPYLAPPGIPHDRLAALRAAFDATVNDPSFRAAAEKANLTIDGPMTGADLTTLVARLMATPPEIPKRIEAIFKAFQGG